MSDDDALSASSNAALPKDGASGRIALLQSRALSVAGFRHGFTTRTGGVSEAPYDSLDFALLRSPERLRENQRRLATALGLDAAQLHQTKQVHGRGIVVADGAPGPMLEQEADALVAEPGTAHAVVVRVADCVPVLIADPKSGRVAAVHAGWRGIEARILAATVEHLAAAERAGSPSQYVAAIGPCIGACCFEVGSDVADRIARAADPRVVVRSDASKAYVDLRLAARVQLEALELDGRCVDDVPGRGPEGCTRCQPAQFHSYRRDGDASGRLVGAIVAR